MIGAYVDAEKAQRAKKILDDSGITLTDVVRAMIDAIIEQKIVIEKELKLKQTK